MLQHYEYVCNTIEMKNFYFRLNQNLGFGKKSQISAETETFGSTLFQRKPKPKFGFLCCQNLNLYLG